MRPGEPGFFCQAVRARTEDHPKAFKDMMVDMAFSYALCAKQDYEFFFAERSDAPNRPTAGG